MQISRFYSPKECGVSTLKTKEEREWEDGKEKEKDQGKEKRGKKRKGGVKEIEKRGG